jgi:hypothetical protein
MLRPFYDFPINFEKVGSFKSLEAKEIEGEISLKVNDLVNLFVILMNNFPDLFRKQRGLPSTFVFTVVKLVGNVKYGSVGFLSEIID